MRNKTSDAFNHDRRTERFMNIFDLTTEKIKNPLGIDSDKPNFSWKIEGDNFFQNSYRVKVATDESLLDGEADMWDSGEVNADCSIDVEYAGKPLKSCTRYFWCVYVNGVKSESAWFETAFLNPEKEFIARWIGQPLGFSGAVDDVRFDFFVDKPVKSARFYVAALGMGRFYFNGKLLEDNYFDGSVAVYSKQIYYRTYALDIKTGKNALCAKLGYGFYGAKKMYGILRVEFEDGSISTTATFPGRVWNVKKDSIILNGVYDGETYDARKDEDWLNPEYKVTFGNWVAAFAADAPCGKLKSNPVPPMRIVETFSPVKIKKTQGGLLVDAGVNVAGFLTVVARAKKGKSYTVKHAEKLTAEEKLDNANFRAAECIDKYIFNGSGVEKYTPEFTYHGFRYAYIEIEDGVEIIDIKVNHLRTDIKQCGYFDCSDTTLNRLHKIAVQTESNNINGVYTDCPQRDERLGWLNDLTARIYQSLCNFSNEKFLADFIDKITQSQNEKGIIPDTVPFEVGSDIGDFVSAYTVLGFLYYKWYGDKRVLARNYQGFKKWIEYIKNDADEHGGVAEFGIYGDWCPALIYALSKECDTYSKFVEPKFMSAAYFLWYLQHMREISLVLGYTNDFNTYSEYYEKYKQKFDEKYYNKKSGVYGGGSQAECAVAMTVFKQDAELCAELAEIAEKDIREKGYHMTCGNQSYRHLLYNLCEFGYAQTVYKLLVNREYPGYGYMLEKGATTVWERWEYSVGSDMHSFDHPMFASYDGYFYNYILGIRTEECSNAFKEIVIEPCFIDNLNFAEGYIDTVRGKISVKWARKNEKIICEIQTPSNTNTVFRAKKFAVGEQEYSLKANLSNGYFKLVIYEN